MARRMRASFGAEASAAESVPIAASICPCRASAPNDARILLAIGRVYLTRAERTHDTESITRARNAIEKAIAKAATGEGSRSEGLALYGRVQYLAGNYPGAERTLQDAVATSPVDPEAFGFLADAADRLGHDETARDALVNLDAIEGDTAPSAQRLSRARRIGDLSLQSGDFTSAIKWLGRALDMEANDAVTLAMMAEARWRTGDTAAARTLIAKALAADPRDLRIQRVARVIR